MAAGGRRPKIIVIVGPTASGKSALAMRLAEAFNGEIIAADSRTVYKGMDIGTAKPTKTEQAKIPHHLLNLIEPDQKFSAGQFKKCAERVITDIQKRGRLPIVVGGTGLYIDSLIFDYQFDPDGGRDPRNPRHRLKKFNTDQRLRPGVVVIGLQPTTTNHQSQIERRIERMLEQGLIDEVVNLAQKYPSDLEAFKAPGYQPFWQYVNGQIDLETAKQLFIQADLKLAKKQRTWFKRNPHIRWFGSPKQAYGFIAKTFE